MKPLWSALNLSLTKQSKPTMLISQIENVAQCDKKIVSCYNMSKKISAHISLELRTSPHSFFISIQYWRNIKSIYAINKFSLPIVTCGHKIVILLPQCVIVNYSSPILQITEGSNSWWIEKMLRDAANGEPACMAQSL